MQDSPNIGQNACRPITQPLWQILCSFFLLLKIYPTHNYFAKLDGTHFFNQRNTRCSRSKPSATERHFWNASISPPKPFTWPQDWVNCTKKCIFLPKTFGTAKKYVLVHFLGSFKCRPMKFQHVHASLSLNIKKPKIIQTYSHFQWIGHTVSFQTHLVPWNLVLWFRRYNFLAQSHSAFLALKWAYLHIVFELLHVFCSYFALKCFYLSLVWMFEAFCLLLFVGGGGQIGKKGLFQHLWKYVSSGLKKSFFTSLSTSPYI